MQINLPKFLELRNQLPVVDVRSEGEFRAGHIDSAINIPILKNEERIAVGTDYKQKGQREAIKTGFRLVGPRILDIVNEAEKIAAGKEFKDVGADRSCGRNYPKLWLWMGHQ